MVAPIFFWTLDIFLAATLFGAFLLGAILHFAFLHALTLFVAGHALLAGILFTFSRHAANDSASPGFAAPIAGFSLGARISAVVPCTEVRPATRLILFDRHIGIPKHDLFGLAPIGNIDNRLLAAVPRLTLGNATRLVQVDLLAFIRRHRPPPNIQLRGSYHAH